MRKTVIFFTVFIFPVVCFAATLHVPSVYPALQDAIDAAVNGDTVLVAPGTYYENIDFLGKAITLKSENGPDLTVIDGNRTGSVVTFENQEGLDSVLDGFTVMNGSGTPSFLFPYYSYGGGIICTYAVPTITNNIISGNSANYFGGICCSDRSNAMISNNTIIDNHADYHGGGIGCSWSSSPTIMNNCISMNSAANCGGGIYCYFQSSPSIVKNTIGTNSAGQEGGAILGYDSCSPCIENNLVIGNMAKDWGGGIEFTFNGSPTISNNIIAENSVELEGGGGILLATLSSGIISNNLVYGNSAVRGGGIECYNSASPIIANNTLYGNSAENTGGGIKCYQSSPIITNTIVWNNFATFNSEIDVYMGGPTVTYCNVRGGWPGTGNIDADPLFVDPTNNDFHLSYTSPCRDTGNNSAVTGLLDFEGDPRIAWGGTVDMGADEFYTHLYITGDQTPGGEIKGKFVGQPGSSPVCLFIGLGGVHPIPLPTAYGDLWLLPPKLLIPLIPIPANGVLDIQTIIPLTPPAPYDLPMQGLIGLTPESLTNLCVLEVR